jgi:hypothetical protein
LFAGADILNPLVGMTFERLKGKNPIGKPIKEAHGKVTCGGGEWTCQANTSVE